MFLDIVTREKADIGSTSIPITNKSHKLVKVVDTCDLRIYYPEYSKIDLVCGTIPSKEDHSVIMIAEAAFTGELLEDFKHTNIAGDHISNGIREKGYRCKRNNGAFVMVLFKQSNDYF